MHLNKTKSIEKQIVLLLALWVIFLFKTGFCQDTNYSNHNNRPQRKKFRRNKKRFLGLTQQQRKSMRKIHQKYSFKLEDIRMDVEEAQIFLMHELKKPSPNQKVIDKWLNQIARLQRRHNKIVINEYFEIRKILTPRQSKFFLRRIIRSMSGGARRRKKKMR